jgi:hypothetical protein
VQTLAGDITVAQQVATTADAGASDTVTLAAAGGIGQSGAPALP